MPKNDWLILMGDFNASGSTTREKDPGSSQGQDEVQRPNLSNVNCKTSLNTLYIVFLMSTLLMAQFTNCKFNYYCYQMVRLE